MSNEAKHPTIEDYWIGQLVEVTNPYYIFCDTQGVATRLLKTQSGQYVQILAGGQFYEVEIHEVKPIPEAFYLAKLEFERLAWSLKTFPDATPISSLRKLESEIREIEVNIFHNERKPEEYADALMCLLDSAGRLGITVQEIIDAFAVKHEINKARTWIKNPDNSYSHVKP